MWKETNLRIFMIGGLLEDEAYKTMKAAEPEKFKQIANQFTDIAAGEDTIVVENEHGELAIRCAGQFYPMQCGSWVRVESVMYDEPEEVEYNVLVPYGGLNHLLIVEPPMEH